MISEISRENINRKKELIQRVLNYRTRHVALVFQDTYQTLNASAAIRTAEIFGLQEVYTIEEKNIFRSSVGISRGAVAWVDIMRFNNTLDTIIYLKKQGYTIVTTTLAADAIPIDRVPVDKKLALVFGNELWGVNEELISMTDIKTYIPMYGFTQSFNLSVSVGICLQEIMPKVRANTAIDWQLTNMEKIQLSQKWTTELKIN